MIEQGNAKTQSTKAVQAKGGKLGLSSNELPHLYNRVVIWKPIQIFEIRKALGRGLARDPALLLSPAQVCQRKALIFPALPPQRQSCLRWAQLTCAGRSLPALGAAYPWSCIV